MRVSIAAVVALLWQMAGAVSPTPEHLRWQREILISGAGGAVCAALDARTLAHAASRSADDLRVFREAATGEVEVPFSLTESEAESDDAAEATVENAKVRGSEMDFDLEMPRRAYSSVDLKIAAKDFVGSVAVTEKSGKALGSFAIFDLSSEGLARSTTLSLAETSLPELHVSLRMHGLHGEAAPVTVALVQGAAVPASREAQTLYTEVAATQEIHQQGARWSIVKEMWVPAHVPVERVRFVLEPGFRGEFWREVSVGGRRWVNEEAGTVGSDEVLTGSIWRVRRPGIAAERLGTDAVMGLTMRDAAKIVVTVHNVVGNKILPPLPIREVRLEMRQRSVCFAAAGGAKYVLRYGDAGLGAPVYRQMEMAPRAGVATLGPESANPEFRSAPAMGEASQRRVGVAWMMGVGGLVLIWATAGSFIRRRRRG